MTLEPQSHPIFSVRRQVLWPLTATLLIFIGMFIAMAYRHFTEDIRASERQELKAVDQEFTELLFQRTQVMAVAAESLVKDPLLQQLMLVGDRQRLYDAALPFFTELSSSQQITHCYFHSPDAVNFLRVHQPARYGDHITRHTMAKAIKSGLPSSGMELGPLGTFTLRSVFPWVVDSQVIGFIELGEEVDHLLRRIQERSGANLIVTLDKTRLKRSAWESGMRMLDRQGDWEQFDEEIIADVIFPGQDVHQVMFRLEQMQGVFEEMALNLGESHFRGRRLPLFDVAGDQVGSFLVFTDVTQRLADFHGLVRWVIIFCILSGGGLFWVLFHSLGKADRQLAQLHGQLVDELNHGRLLNNSLVEEVEERRSAQQALKQARDHLEERVLERTAELDAERSFLQTVIDGVTDPLMVVGLDCQVLRMNEAARHQVSVDSANEQGGLCHKVSHHSDQPCSGLDHPCPLIEVRKFDRPVSVLHKHQNADGEKRIFQLSASPFHDQNGKLIGIIEGSRDVTELLQVRQELMDKKERILHMSCHDALTDLPNHAYCLEQFPHYLRRASLDNCQAAVLFLDLDRFKKINDTLGHDLGDQFLKLVAGRIKNSLRVEDVLARFGGDEFIVLIQNIMDPTQVVRLVNRLLAELEPGFDLLGHHLYISASIGISFFPTDAETIDDLIKLAEIAMYRAKEEGRSTYQFYTRDMDSRAREFLHLEGELREAIQNEHLILHYQPQFELASGRLIGVEALVRWQHPERGLVPPGDFIPLAEESGLILQIGQWVLGEACRQAVLWQAQGLGAVRMAVNISARQFMQSDLVGQVESLLKESGLAAHCLELEITESVIMGNVKVAVETMHELNRMGVKLAIDDFGSGYSSLSYLKRFPISKLKIDRSFVNDVTVNINDAAIARSVIALGQSMSLEVIAEGIETQDQLDFLRNNGCAQGQGYLYSRPLATADCERFLADKSHENI